MLDGRFMLWLCGLWVGSGVAWCGVAALATLSIWQPQDWVAQTLLGVWVIAAVMATVKFWPQDNMQGGPSKGFLIFMAPFCPLYLAGVACRRVLNARRK